MLEAGQYNNGIYFVLSGVIGLFELIDGKEVFQNFFLANDFANELESLTSKNTSRKNLIALSEAKCFYLDRSELLGLYEKSIVYERLGRKLLEHILAGQNELSALLQGLKPHERYAYVQERRPELLNAVSLTHLSSYLGVARETLSRIRGKY